MTHIQEQAHGQPCPLCGEINSADRVRCWACGARMVLPEWEEQPLRSLSIEIKPTPWAERWQRFGSVVVLVVASLATLFCLLRAADGEWGWLLLALLGVCVCLLPVFVRMSIERKQRLEDHVKRYLAWAPINSFVVSLMIAILTAFAAAATFAVVGAAAFFVVCTASATYAGGYKDGESAGSLAGLLAGGAAAIGIGWLVWWANWPKRK
jgi:fructose-specific phosphotransferase system IIC component